MTAPPSLWDRFAALPDPRSPLGRRHLLPALLALVTVAVLCGARSLEAVAQFARDRRPAFAFALGFTRRDTPCKATLSNTLRRLDADALERAPAGRAAGAAPRSPSTARRSAARPTGPPASTCWPPTPRPSAASWPSPASARRPTSTRPRWSCSAS